MVKEKPYFVRRVDPDELRTLVRAYPLAQDAFNYYWDTLVPIGITKHDWRTAAHKQMDKFARTYCDPMRDADVTVCCELIRFSTQLDPTLHNDGTLKKVAWVELQAQAGRYHKHFHPNTDEHKEKWNLLMILLEAYKPKVEEK